MSTPVELRAADGTRLAATHFLPGGALPARAVVMVCGGGIPRRVYRRFASYLAEQGNAVLTWDARGIGESRPGSLRGYVAGLEDWAELDCAAAVAWMRARHPALPLVGFSHSIGALVLAAAPNAGDCARFVLVGPHTGYCGDYHPHWRLPMTLAWHRLMPALTHVFGRFPGRALGLGEDLPARFALQWAGRRQAAIAVDTPRVKGLLQHCTALRGQGVSLTFVDDGFATDDGAMRLLALLPGVRVERRLLSPTEVGLPGIGHFGAFRPSAAERLWPLLADAVANVEERQGPAPAPLLPRLEHG